MSTPPKPVDRTCQRPGCGAPFTAPHERSNRVYCSATCRETMRHDRRVPEGERVGKPLPLRKRTPGLATWPTPINMPAFLEARARGEDRRVTARRYGLQSWFLGYVMRRAGVRKQRRKVPFPPPPIVHHLAPLRSTWPIGSTSY